MKLYFCDDINISYDQLIKLNDNKKIFLNIDNILAINILSKGELRPGNTYLYTS